MRRTSGITDTKKEFRVGAIYIAQCSKYLPDILEDHPNILAAPLQDPCKVPKNTRLAWAPMRCAGRNPGEDELRKWSKTVEEQTY